MGMYDSVNFTMPCPNCGKQLSDFQTKDKDCTLITVEPDMVSNFYDYCSCRCWVEFTRDYPCVPNRDVPLSLAQVEALGFRMSVKVPDTNGDEEK